MLLAIQICDTKFCGEGIEFAPKGTEIGIIIFEDLKYMKDLFVEMDMDTEFVIEMNSNPVNISVRLEGGNCSLP